MNKVMLCCISAFFALQPLLARPPVEIALTFDDFPMNKSSIFGKKDRVKVYAEKLAHHNIQAAFFCIGEQMDSAEGIECMNLIGQNQLLANHSYHHKHLSSISVNEFQEELFSSAELMEERPNYRQWFRFPYLDYGDRTVMGGTDRKRTAAFLALRQAGYQHAYVTINTFDWYVDYQLKQALKGGKEIHWDRLRAAYMALLEEWIDDYHTCWCSILKRPVVHVLLLHQNDLNALFLDDIVGMIQNKGWVIVSPDVAFSKPIPYLSHFANTKVRLFRTRGVLTKEHVEEVLSAYVAFSEEETLPHCPE